MKGVEMNDELDIEAELERFEAEERARLGLGEAVAPQWADAMVDPTFLASERPKVTLLFGGLTVAHDFLIQAALRGMRYQARMLDCPDNEALRAGKEFGNRGQCNPTYYTVGNLVKELTRLRDEEGMSTQEIIDGHLFLTASACGPCRFGMYVTEYRKALRDAGFDGFRVLLFQQTGGFKQATGEELGLVLNPPFFIALLKAMLAGDVLNAMAYRLRPYELDRGAADAALEAAKADCYAALENQRSVLFALYRARRHFAAVRVDRLMAKPKVSVIGEFWAMTTEGDGNYHLQRFLEQEGAECQIQLLANLLLYNLWEYRHDTKDRALLRDDDEAHYGLAGVDPELRMAGLWFGQMLLRVAFKCFSKAIGLHGYPLTDMDELAEIASDLYDVDLRGGEGHTEVAKVILDVKKKKSHMTVSVKPFGCMPSSGVSDGVQSAVTERFPEAIFCAVETSGDGAVNFYSRVQMVLFKARLRAQEELESVLAEHGVTLDQVRREMTRACFSSFARAPHVGAGTAADIVRHLAPLVGKGPIGRARTRAARAALRARHLAAYEAPKTWAKAKEIAPYVPAMLRFVAQEAGDALPRAKAAWAHVVERLVPRVQVDEAAPAESSPEIAELRLPILN
jgi:predicted nucleotide-binding protein (sugar kinase/HSP70/actin superfamily)